MFRKDNTEGYEQAELDIMNDAMNHMIREEYKSMIWEEDMNHNDKIQHRENIVERLLELANEYIVEIPREETKAQLEFYEKHSDHLSDCFVDTMDIIESSFTGIILHTFRNELNHTLQGMIVDVLKNRRGE